MDYATAVNEEIKDLFAAGADVVQLDEPYMQARPAKAKQYGVQVLNRALQGVTGTTAVHICFRLRSDYPSKAVGLTRSCPNSKRANVQQISIETAQSHLDCERAHGAIIKDHSARGLRSFGHDCRDAGDCG